MKKLLPYLLLVYLLSIQSGLLAQQLNHRQGELIVQFQDYVEAKDWLRQQAEVSSYQHLSRALNIWLIHFDHTQFHAEAVRRKLFTQPEVVFAQYNHLITHRATPNDPRYSDQWQLNNTGQAGGNEGADFNVESAWDVTTGGVTPNGDTIVVCAIDNGYDTDHVDLVDNLWTNLDEIPDNGIDDDNNGFIDDVHGWNTADDNNDLEGGPHGTSVAGIIGATGNNSLGVTGMSWNVKVMMIRNNFFAAESEVLQAYSYALDSRIAYDESGGAEGAYVVATNASWGINGGDPEDSPIWCGLYETLGLQGILNVGATANVNINVDEDGDLPTTCPSEYLISVTNLNGLDELVDNAGFGAINIDLGAYGENVITTRNNNSYGPFCCTSASAPAVAGAIGLLYSAPSAPFGELLTADPAAAARFMRDVILDNVRPISDLNGVTVTGGGLDLGSAMTALMGVNSTCFAPTSIQLAPVGANGISVSWNSVQSVNSVTLRFRLAGTTTWTNIENATSPFLLADLSNCGFYEVQLISNCTEESTASEIFTIETAGCCKLPTGLDLISITSTTVVVDWEDVLAGERYVVRLRPLGTTEWTEFPALGTIAGIQDLSNCTEYELEIKTDCDTSQTDFGLRTTFLTEGCGICIDAPYCQPAPPNNTEEWISELNFGNLFSNNTGAAPDGYFNYGLLPGGVVTPGMVIPVSLRPAHSGNSFTEGFRVYVDWNLNGFFNSNEVAGEGQSMSGQAITIPITVPDDAPPGLPRMRIVMQFLNASSACNVQSRPGEVEDYCLLVEPSLGCVPPAELTAVYREDSESVLLSWPASLAPGGAYVLRYRQRNTMAWTEIMTTNLSQVLDDFTLCDLFEAEIASVCSDTLGAFATTIFNSCSSVNTPEIPAADWQISPNPTSGPIRLSYRGEDPLRQVKLYGVDGKIQATFPADGDQVFDLSQLPAGVYILQLVTQRGLVGVKRVIIR
ncbi:MAG: S8 family serine peptidase [Bacteroidota bacterium]